MGATDAGRCGLSATAIAIPVLNRNWRGAIASAGSLLVAHQMCTVVKHLVPESRPDGSNDQSFPSSHSLEAFSAAMSLAKHSGPSLGLPAFVAAGMVAYGSTPVLTTSKFLPVESAAAVALGAKPLRPEKSLNYTAGVTYEAGRLHLTVDAYEIRVYRRIVKTEFLGTAVNGGAAINAILVANGITGVNSAQFFINGVDTRTRGIDAVADYSLRTLTIGTFHLSAAYSYNKTKILSIADNPAQLASLNVTLFAHQALSDLTRGLPHDKIVLTDDWSLGRVHATARHTRFGKYVEASTVASGDRSFGAKWVTDLDVGYDLTDRIRLSDGANNLFGVYPDKYGLIAYDGSGQYGSFATFGLSGGFYYGRLSLKL